MTQLNQLKDQQTNDNFSLSNESVEKIKEVFLLSIEDHKKSIKTNYSAALEKYHHPKMKADELRTIHSNVADRTELPDITERIMAMIL